MFHFGIQHTNDTANKQQVQKNYCACAFWKFQILFFWQKQQHQCLPWFASVLDEFS